jgi:hypothetical protein
MQMDIKNIRDFINQKEEKNEEKTDCYCNPGIILYHPIGFRWWDIHKFCASPKSIWP